MENYVLAYTRSPPKQKISPPPHKAPPVTAQLASADLPTVLADIHPDESAWSPAGDRTSLR